jgi:WD40 repeat protein
MFDWKNNKEGKQVRIRTEKATKDVPVMCIAFPEYAPVVKQAMLAVCSDGYVSRWDMAKQKCLNSFMETGNETYTVGYNKDASLFCTGGLDRKLRVYDDETCKLVTEPGVPELGMESHGNRISAVMWSKVDPNILISGGWDNTVKIWDVRDNKCVRQVFGPYVTGEGLDTHGEMILTGSARPSEQVEIWDLRTSDPLQAIKWPSSTQDPCVVYACHFSKNGKYVVAGGAFSSEVLVFGVDSGLSVGVLGNMTKSVYTAEFSFDHQHVACGGADGNIYVMQYSKNKPKQTSGLSSPPKPPKK